MNIPIGIYCMSMGIKGVIDVLSEAKWSSNSLVHQSEGENGLTCLFLCHNIIHPWPGKGTEFDVWHVKVCCVSYCLQYDWSDLPTEILGIVFEYCLCDSESAAGYVEVDELRRRIQRLQSVCRIWANVRSYDWLIDCSHCYHYISADTTYDCRSGDAGHLPEIGSGHIISEISRWAWHVGLLPEGNW